MLNFYHTYWYFKDIIRTDFCEIYVILWDLFDNKRQVFKSYIRLDWQSAGRPGWSTGAEVRQPVQSTDVHRTCTQTGLVGRSTGGRSSRELCSLEIAPVGRQRALLSVSSLGRLGWSTGGTTVRNLTVGAGQSGSRPEGQFCPFQLPTGRILWGL